MKKITPRHLKYFANGLRRRVLVFGKPKIFCIGLNKTGTTSIRATMDELGYIVGNQQVAEGLLHEYAIRDFKPLLKYCKSAQFFQDAPFSFPYTFIVLDHYFPESKFILTVRDSAEQWYNSITKFHGRKWGLEGRVPTKVDLINATYLYKGRPWDSNRYLFNTPEHDPYKKEELIRYYNRHNENVADYFRMKPEQLLTINVGEKGAYKKLCNFLEKKPMRDEFPWKNKTTEVQ